MSRKDDLIFSIGESYTLIREYEGIIRVSSDPKEMMRCKHAIKSQRRLVVGHAREYGAIMGSLPADMEAPLLEVGVWVCGHCGSANDTLECTHCGAPRGGLK